MKKMDIKRVLGWLGFFLRCPVCAAKYSMDNIKVIEGETDESTSDTRLLIHSDCVKCKSSVMFNMDIAGPDIMTVCMITDLNAKDTSKFAKYNPINANDCINIHATLKSFDGDFVKALSVK